MTPPASNPGIASVNPATGELIEAFEPFSATQTSQCLAQAAHAFAEWRRQPFSARAALFNRAAEILDSEKEQFGRTMTLEMGKTLRSAIQEMEKCALSCRFYAENAQRFLTDEPVAMPQGQAFIRFHPLGPVLAVMPWNFPFWQVFRFAGPSLMAGNVALLKHASNVPRCALAIEDVFRRAGFPRGVFQTLLVSSGAVPEIIADPGVAAVTLTGSVAAGASVASLAGRHVKKSVLELGGSDPFIVLPSAQLDRAVETAVQARMINNGQSCIAAKRFIVHEQIAAEFEDRFIRRVAALKIGDPLLPDTDLGPLATAEVMRALHQQVQATVRAGAKVLTGGHPLPGKGFFYAPTVLADIPDGTPAKDDELFGPVASIFRASDLRHAIELANDTPFGLGAAAWTNDPAEQERLIEELQAGQVFVNGMVASDPRMPFGGVKNSGYGRELGRHGILEFVNVKTVVVQNGPRSTRAE